MFRALYAVLPPLFVASLGALLALWHPVPGALLALFFLLDAQGRYRDYKYLSGKDYLTVRLADYYGQSFCGRWMVCAAGEDLRSPVCWQCYYYQQGYRIYHIFPDGFPRCLMNVLFWRNLFKGHR